MSKSTNTNTVIRGADGPTSVFVIRRDAKLTLRQKIQKMIYTIKRNYVERTLRAESHTLDEVMEYIVNTHGFVELDNDEVNQEYKEMRASCIMQHAPSFQGNVTEVYETYMIIHFVTNGYPYGADCSVSLTPVYGDSYTDVSVGDEVVVYFDGNIMETAPLQLGTVYAITLRTPANRIEEDIVIENSVKVTEPPKLLVVCGEEQATALRGTYSWEYSNEDGTGTGIEAYSAHPLECKEIMPDVGIIFIVSNFEMGV